MTQGLKSATLAVVISALAGCSAVGVVSSSDPHQKLADADALLDQNRPLPAERLIVEALAICKTTSDPLCFADAYRTYGLFFMSPTLRQWETHYTTNAFLEPDATFATRYVKSNEYFEKSRAIYAQAGQFEVVTNINLNRGFAYEMAADTRLACQAYNDSLNASKENSRLKPGAIIQVPAKYGTFENYIAIQKSRAGCAVEG
ncbi:hypothetical protein ACYZUC_15125 [Pseudomonas sp. GT1P32]